MVDFIGRNWIIKNIDTVLVDKDGTFLDDNLYWGKLAECRIRKIISHFNLDKTYFNDLCFAIGCNPQNSKLIKNGPVGILSRNEVIDFMVNELNKYNILTDFNTISMLFNEVHREFSENIEQYVRAIEYSEEFIKNLKISGVKLAVVTSDTYEHTVKILNILKLSSYFDCVIGKDSCKEEKRTGKPALLAIEKLHSEAKNAIVIGDAIMDYEMGKNANLKGEIMVATGQTEIETLKKYSDFVVSCLDEVKIK